ncbi:hypothetical protein ACWGDE_36560, partial [Streptomyces sp. NPDC054956]
GLARTLRATPYDTALGPVPAGSPAPDSRRATAPAPRPAPVSEPRRSPAPESGAAPGFAARALSGQVFTRAPGLVPGFGSGLEPGLEPGLGLAPSEGAAPAWSVEGGAGRVDAGGVLRAARPGRLAVHARSGAARGTVRLDVLGPPVRVRAVPERIGLAEEGESARFELTGYDAQGSAAVIEPRDVALEFDRAKWSVSDDGRGGFTVSARVPRATGELRATVRGAAFGAAELALGAGLSDRPLADLEDAGRWTGTGAAAGEGHPGRGLALALPAGGGSASAAPPRPLPVPELARSLSLQVKGDGSGARPAVEVTDGDGAVVTLRGPAVDWTGWREVGLPLPAMAERPFTVTRISATAAGQAPGARLLLDTLAARTPPTGFVRTPAAPDPIVATDAQVRSRPWRFAIEPAAGARTGAGGPGGAAGADFAFTGAGRPAFAHRGVRFLPLDAGRRTLDGGGLARITALRAALAAAAREADTGAVAVVQPYAPQAVDRKEAALRLRLLSEFRRTTGKRVAVITLGAPGFAAGRTEGVLVVTAPRTGRTVIGADAHAAGDWLSVLPASR